MHFLVNSHSDCLPIQLTCLMTIVCIDVGYVVDIWKKDGRSALENISVAYLTYENVLDGLNILQGTSARVL